MHSTVDGPQGLSGHSPILVSFCRRYPLCRLLGHESRRIGRSHQEALIDTSALFSVQTIANCLTRPYAGSADRDDYRRPNASSDSKRAVHTETTVFDGKTEEDSDQREIADRRHRRNHPPSCAQYGDRLKKAIDQRLEEMKEDDKSHFLIYQVLVVGDREGRLVDEYQTKGRFLYKYAGSLLGGSCEALLSRKIPRVTIRPGFQYQRAMPKQLWG